MNLQEHILVCLLEECNEIQEVIFEEKYKKLKLETNDLFGVVEVLKLNKIIEFNYIYKNESNMESIENNLKYLNKLINKLFYFTSKTLRFGFESKHNDINRHGNNKEEIEYYLQKINRSINYLKYSNNFDIIEQELIENKKNKVLKYINISKTLKTII